MELSTENLWADHHKQLELFIRSKVKDKDLAKDILQDVFLKIHNNLNKLGEKEKSAPWIYQIARNCISDHFRKQKHFVNSSDIDVQEEVLPISSNHRFARCLTAFIKDLPGKYKEAITKVGLENISQIELARQLNISYSGAKSRVQRANEMLKAHFLKCCNVSTDKYGNIVTLKEKSKCGLCEV